MADLHPRLRLLLLANRLLHPKSTHERPPEAARKAVEASFFQARLLLEFPPADLYRTEDRMIPVGGTDIPVRLYYPSAMPVHPVTLFFHGGGFTVGSLRLYDLLCRRLANQSGSLVVSVGYRLAPEHKFPAGLEDCYQALRWVEQHIAPLGGDPARIAVAGDSAGGNLATAVCILARDRQGPRITAQALIYPVTDGTMAAPSISRYGRGYYLEAETMRWFMDCYTSSPSERAHPLVSPLLHPDLRGLPPALVLTAEYDPLHDEGQQYAARLREAGNEVACFDYPGMIHSFFMMPRWVSPAREAMQAAANFLRTRLRD
ncbi:MAG: alpha/beta hydrolase [Bacteroidia bacterium]|nr:alpha/beta hydrolase [Bacteroidia bacterium]